MARDLRTTIPLTPFESWEAALDAWSETRIAYYHKKIGRPRFEFETQVIIRRAFITIPTRAKTKWSDAPDGRCDATQKTGG